MKNSIDLLDIVRQSFKDRFGFTVEDDDVRIDVMAEQKFLDFVSVNNLLPRDAMFIPELMKIYVNAGSPFAVSHLIHEVMGHALYHLHAKPGQDTFGFDDKRYMFNIAADPSEQFAMVIEPQHMFTLGLEDLWYQMYENFSARDKEIMHHLAKEYKEYQLLGTLGRFGFPKIKIDNDDLMKTVYRLTGYMPGNVVMTIMYGSRKPYSDIDLVVVTHDDMKDHFREHWLDVEFVGLREFDRRVQLFDIAYCNPLQTGVLISGDPEYHSRCINHISSGVITQDAVNHNINQAHECISLQDKFVSARDREKCMGYYRSYLRNSEQLRKGVREFGIGK